MAKAPLQTKVCHYEDRDLDCMEKWKKTEKKWFPDFSVVSEGVSPASAKHVANTCKTFTAVHIFVFVCFSWMNQNRTKWMKYVWDGRMVTVRRLNRLWLVPACLKLSKSNSTRDNLIWPANWHPVKSRQPSFHEGNDSESKPEGNSRSKQPWYALGLCIFFEIGAGFGVHQRHIGRRMPSQTWRPRICWQWHYPTETVNWGRHVRTLATYLNVHLRCLCTTLKSLQH
jgi:hypothetical protein